MRVAQVTAHGGPEVFATTDLPTPTPGAGEVRIKLEAIGVNFIDIYHRIGLYPIAAPFVPGMEGAGVVDALGPEVSGVEVGERVVYAMTMGSYAEYAVVPAATVVAIPDSVATTVAAATMLQGLTAHYLATSTFELQPDSVALIHAAAGGVGRLLVQIAKRRGATVYATVSTAEKAEMARALGADHVIRYTEEDFAEAVERLTDGAGVDVVYDSVGQATLDGSLASLRRRGLLVSYGNSSGAITDFQPVVLSQRGSLFLTRPTLSDYVADRAELTRRADELFAWVGSGQLDILIHREYPLAEAGQAQSDLAGRGTVGKLLLIP